MSERPDEIIALIKSKAESGGSESESKILLDYIAQLEARNESLNDIYVEGGGRPWYERVAEWREDSARLDKLERWLEEADGDNQFTYEAGNAEGGDGFFLEEGLEIISSAKNLREAIDKLEE